MPSEFASCVTHDPLKKNKHIENKGIQDGNSRFFATPPPILHNTNTSRNVFPVDYPKPVPRRDPHHGDSREIDMEPPKRRDSSTNAGWVLRFHVDLEATRDL